MDSAGKGGVGKRYRKSPEYTTTTKYGITSRKHFQTGRSHNPWHEANRKAVCGKTARTV